MGSAQPRLEKCFSHHHYTTYNGLPQSQVTFLYQDSIGYLWVCTKGGISRFDGKNFLNFNDPKNHTDRTFYDIEEYGGQYYFLTGNSILQYNNCNLDSVSIFPLPDSVSSSEQHMYCDPFSEALLLFNSKNKNHRSKHCCYRFDIETRKFTCIGVNKWIRKVLIDEQTRRIYAFSDTSYYTIENGNVLSCSSIDVKIVNYAVDENNQLWGRGKYDSQFYKIEVNNNRIALIPHGVFNKKVANYFGKSHLFHVVDGTSIFSTFDNELYKVNQYGTTRLNEAIFPTIILIDRNKNIWVGTETGLYNYYQANFEQYKFNITSVGDNVWGIVQDEDENMWFAGYSTGLWSMSPEGVIKEYSAKDFHPDIDEGMFRNQYMSPIRDEKDRLFFTYEGRLLVNDGDEIRNFFLKSGCLFIKNDEKNNRVLFGCKDLVVLDKSNWELEFYPTDPLSYIISIVDLDDGRFLCGSFNRQYVFDNVKLTALPDTFAYKGVVSMVRDSLGNIWKGTNSGLYHSSPTKETRVGTEAITQMIGSVFLYKNWLFVATLNKLHLIDINEFYSTGQARIKTFGQHHGFMAMDVGQNGFYLDSENYLWFTVGDKVLRFKPEEVANAYFPDLQKPHITDLSYSTDNTTWESIDEKTSISLQSATTALKFEAFASNFNNPGQLVYRYKLVGLNDHWNSPTNVSEITFNNLRPGKYQLHVQSSVNGRDWSETTYSPEITIVKLWWQKWYIIFIEVFLAVAIIAYISVLFYRQKQKAFIQKLNEQKRLNELRLRSIRSKHIPHFSGNALANIEYYIFNNDLLEANKFLGKYSNMMNITLRDAEKSCRSISSEIEYVETYLEIEKMRFQNKLEYKFQIEPQTDLSTKIPNMLLHTWVENAIKHGLRHLNEIGKILIVIKPFDKGILIAVEDNGIGREKAKKLGTGGSGNGLSILKEQMGIYNSFNTRKMVFAENDVLNTEGNIVGTRFELFIPENFTYEN
ncbi:MAG: histidine kinase [Prolixibacteraceae bacterium]|nr:histidine kinase [Prolixibacteraceae bacterium]